MYFWGKIYFMKNLGKLALVFSMFLLVGCSKDMESRLPGTWDYSTVVTFSGMSTTSTGSMTFNDNGTGSATQTGSTATAFEWTSKDDESITLNGEVLTNTKNKRKEQVFENAAGSSVMTLKQD